MQDMYMCGAVLLFILLDIISGYAAALKGNTVSSSKMREGIFKKCGSVMVMLVAVAVEHLGGYVGIASAITDAIVYGACGLLTVMEITSVLENCCKLNPDLTISKFFDLFGITNEQAEEIKAAHGESMED